MSYERYKPSSGYIVGQNAFAVNLTTNFLEVTITTTPNLIVVNNTPGVRNPLVFTYYSVSGTTLPSGVRLTRKVYASGDNGATELLVFSDGTDVWPVARDFSFDQAARPYSYAGFNAGANLAPFSSGLARLRITATIEDTSQVPGAGGYACAVFAYATLSYSIVTS